MPLIFETVQTQGIAALSYLIGDDQTGEAAVIDPRADVEIYVELARKRKVSITHVFETHIHADLLSGSRELAARVKTAKVFLSAEGGALYGFEHEAMQDGASFKLGKLVLTAKHTPGHTPEHMSLVAAEQKTADTPWGIFTGDSLFVNSAGRPDLMGDDQAEQLAEDLFDTLYHYYLSLDDALMIYPSHGQGSPCGADIGDRLTSTIGYERKFNPFLQHPDKTKFKEYALATAPPEPTYYKPMKVLNAKGPKVLGNLPAVAGLPPKAFLEAMEKPGVVVIDTRSMLAFGGGHVAGALNIAGLPELSVWAGWLLDPEQSFLLILESDSDVETVVSLFLRTGFVHLEGYLVGGMKAWDNAGFRLEDVNQISVHELKQRQDNFQIVDVRAPGEWKKGHIPGASHIFLPELEKKSNQISKEKPVAVYCDSGYRASIAASILNAQGFEVHNVPGSWQAWLSAQYPVEK